MWRFALLFASLLILLFTLELLPLGQAWVVQPFTAAVADISAWLIQLLDPGVLAQGRVLHDTDSGFAVSIEAGCNGVEATIILVSAMLAFPSAWGMKLIGILSGFLAIQLMNLVRIISLFYLGQWHQAAFEWAHLYIWQSLISIDVLIVFLVWLRYVTVEDTPDAGMATH